MPVIKVRLLIVLSCVAFLLLACSTPSRKTGDYKIALVPARAGQHGIFVVNSDTTGGKLLTPDATAQLRASSWSPDGTTIAFFSARSEDSEMLKKYRMPFHFPLYVMDSAGGDQKRLLDFPVSSFEWSPDSSQILYVSAYEDPAGNDRAVLSGKKEPMSAVYLLSLQTGARRRVTGFGQNSYGSWSPDGTYLALTFGDDQNTGLYAASLDGKHTRRLDDSQGVKIKPVWSPDGKQIAYIGIAPRAEGGTSAAYVIDAGGANKRRIGNLNAYEVSWSRDGRALLIQSPEGLSLVYVADNRAVSLTRGMIQQPRDALFTPDGQEVMFRSNHEGDWHLYAVDLNGAKLRRITGNLSASMFCLSPLKR